MRHHARDFGAIAGAAFHAHGLREAFRSATANVLHHRKGSHAGPPLPVDQSMWCSCMLCGRRFESHWIGRRICPACKAQRD
jgi:hypothetical protein